MSSNSQSMKKIKIPNPFYIFTNIKNDLFIDNKNNKYYLKKVLVRKGKFIHAINKTTIFFENEFISFYIIAGSHLMFQEDSLIKCNATHITIKSKVTPIHKINSPIFEIRLNKKGMIQTIFNHEVCYRYCEKDGKNVFKNASVNRIIGKQQRQLLLV